MFSLLGSWELYQTSKGSRECNTQLQDSCLTIEPQSTQHSKSTRQPSRRKWMKTCSRCSKDHKLTHIKVEWRSFLNSSSRILSTISSTSSIDHLVTCFSSESSLLVTLSFLFSWCSSEVSWVKFSFSSESSGNESGAKITLGWWYSWRCFSFSPVCNWRGTNPEVRDSLRNFKVASLTRNRFKPREVN